jgi:oligopeptide/dipeptide ABC transporter ATP-binding protein
VTDTLLRVEGLMKYFSASRGLVRRRTGDAVRAVDGVTFDVERGETLGIVGESGCGKSTLARCIARLVDVTAGRIEFDGQDITHLSRRDMRPVRKDLAVIFQDPYESLNPRLSVGSAIAEPLEIFHWGSRREIKLRVEQTLERVGLSAAHYDRFPNEFSGGQRQRVGIARALVLEPKLIVCDEPVTALDLSVQAQILNLLADLQAEFGLTYIFIAHDLDIVRHVSDRVHVMYLGRAVEQGPTHALYTHPRHPYTASLLSAVPVANPRLARAARPIVLEGDVPSPLHPPSGCRFHPRCPRAQALCADEEPRPTEFEPGHEALCHFPVERWPMN